MSSSVGRLGRPALVLLALVASACTPYVGARQADRSPSPHVQVPAVERPSTIHIVERGRVIEQFPISGVVAARDTTPVSVPYPVVVTSGPPRIGERIEEGETVFSYEPSPWTRAVAAEYEASRYALTHGSGPADQREARYLAARDQAERAGLPVDDPNAFPLPDLIEVPSPISGIVLRALDTGSSPVEPGTVVVEVGRGEDLFVEGTATDSVSELLALGHEVDVSQGGIAGAARVVSISFGKEGSQTITLMAGTGFDPEAEISIDRNDGSGPDVGRIVEVEPGGEGIEILTVEVSDPSLSLASAVEVSPRRDLDTVVVGALESASISGEDAATVVVAVPDTSLPFNESVRVTLFGETRDNVVWLPAEAIRTFDGADYVMVDVGGDHERVDVTVGLRGSGRLEVVGDLSVGDAVLVP